MLDLEKVLEEFRARLALVNNAIVVLEKTQTPIREKSRRGRKFMGREERQTVSERMRKHWAQRRQPDGDVSPGMPDEPRL